MRSKVKWAIKKVKLAVLWVRRILFAPDHFNVPFHTKIWMNLHGFMSDQYALYDLRGDRRKEYLSEFDWYRSRWINEPFDQMLNNKIVCTEVLSHYVAVPETVAIKNKGKIVFWGAPDEVRTTAELEELIAKESGPVFMKPIAAGKGKGVYRLAIREGARFVDDAEVTEEKFTALLTKEDGWFLSRSVRQHPFLDSLYDKTTNTIRLITLRDPKSGAYKVFFAVQRIGTFATIPVDNGSRGGLVACIDLETGELSEARSLHSLEVHEVHPDSGNPIKGAVVPGWAQVKEQALELARTFPYLQFIAWDFLLTEEGLCVIEANTSSGVNIIQLWGPQRNGELGDFYRAHGVLKK